MRYVKIPTQKHFHKKIALILMLIPLVLLVFIGLTAVFLKGPATVFKYIIPGIISPLEYTDGRVNVLLLGNAGGTHDGAYLTDTIMVASYNLKSNQAFFISLPRDLWVDKTKSKLNAVFEIGEAKNESGGLSLSKQVAGDILGIPIHYGVRLDFRGFIKAVDEIGGLDILVEKSFQDSRYPIEGKENDLCSFVEEEREFNEEDAKNLNIEPGKRKVLISPEGKIATDSAEPERGFEYFKCRYEQIGFEKGEQHMNGAIALIFVRSRMGTQGEGSDFARSKRQQKVIEAFRKKVLSLETLINPKKIGSLASTFGQSFETDMSVSDIIEIYALGKKVDKGINFILDTGKRANLPNNKNSLLIVPPYSDYGGAFVLIPPDKNFDTIHTYIKKILSGEVIEHEASASAWVGN